MKNKGFTLIELIAVLVMIGLLIAIVVPNVSNLMKDQNQKKYDLYYTLVNQAVDQYAEARRDDLGGTENEGCVNDFTIGDLIEEEYLKYFDVESTQTCRSKDIYNGGVAVRNCVACGSPADFDIAHLRGAGYSDAGKELKVRISNKEGIVSSEVPIVCIKNNKVVFQKSYPQKTCNKFVAENVATTPLITQLANNVTSTNYQNKDFFVNSDVTNNFIWYSGKLWRAISYNTETGQIKLVTEDPVTTITYDRVTTANQFNSTSIGVWLNTTFYKSLRNPTAFVVDHDWNYSPVTSPTTLPTTGVNRAKVGMLNYFEYNKVQGFLKTGQNWWLLSKNPDSTTWYVSDTNVVRSIANTTFFGVRPSIVLKSGVTFNKGGLGTFNNPYVLKGEGKIVTGVLLKDRVPGEYVKLTKSGVEFLFRIVSSDINHTRLILDTPLNISDLQFHYDDTFYSDSNYIGSYLNTWKNGFNLVNADFCRTTINSTSNLTSVCPQKDIISIDIGIPKVGDMFTTSSNKEYWTMNNFSADKLNVIRSNGTMSNKGILEYSGIRPVINLSGNVRVSGAGTIAHPYSIIN